jgi:hypothetical protein
MTLNFSHALPSNSIVSNWLGLPSSSIATIHFLPCRAYERNKPSYLRILQGVFGHSLKASDCYLDASDNSDCSANLVLSEKYSKTAIITLAAISFIVVLVLLFSAAVVYFIRKYYLSKLRYLPSDISWSFMHYQKYFWMWSYSSGTKTGYYYRSLSPGSDDWKRIISLFHECCDGTMFSIDSIVSVYNPTLTTSFVNQLTVQLERFALSPELFFSHSYSAVGLEERKWAYAKFQARASRSTWHAKLPVPILLCV